jgi:ferrous iron transport protein B
MSTCHDLGMQVEIKEGQQKIVLAGNPNAGKSVVFNALTGLYVDVSNYPGTTLDISSAKFGDDVLIDTPGVYGVSSFNDEERVARDVIMQADVIINVVGALNLERDLFLTQQMIDMGKKVVVALNMIDEAKVQGVEIDVPKLREMLGVPVIPTVAIRKEGLDQVVRAISSATTGERLELVREHQAKYQAAGQAINPAEVLMILEDDPVICERNGVDLPGVRESIYLARRKRVDEIAALVVKEVKQGVKFSVKLGRAMLNPWTGVPILAVVLWVMYEFIGVIVAQDVVGFTEGTIMGGYYEPFVKGVYEFLVNAVGFSGAVETIIRQVLVGDYGLLTMTVTYIFGLLLPLVVGFYLFLAVLEDSGYLPRIATLTDRLLSSIGLNGRAIIPVILGFGCVTMATMTTRLLGSEREKRIAVFLLGLSIPCSAQLGVIAGLLSPLGGKLVLVFVGVILGVFVIAGTIMDRVLPGESTALLIDLPPIRLPKLNNVLKKTWNKSGAFVVEATPIFALGALLITVLQLTGLLEVLQNMLAPLTMGWLKLPREASIAFIMGIVRRDFGAAGLYTMPLTPVQTIIALVTITLFVPCIASVMMMFKERGWKEAIAMWLGTWIIAFFVGGIVAHLI